jgi:hypothetical protein
LISVAKQGVFVKEEEITQTKFFVLSNLDCSKKAADPQNESKEFSHLTLLPRNKSFPYIFVAYLHVSSIDCCTPLSIYKIIHLN